MQRHALADQRASPGGRRATVALLGCGLLITALDVLLVRRLPLFRYFPGPGIPISLREIFDADWQSGTRWYLSVITLQFLLYGGALVAARSVPARPGRTIAVTLPVLFAGVLLWLYPASAADLIHYLAASRIFWVWGDNPLVVPHAAYPFPLGLNYPNLPSPYGPLWTLLTFPGGLLSRIDLRLGLFGLKLVAAGSYLASAWLVDRILRRLAPQRAALGVVAFAWNPFVVYRVVGNGHNSLVMFGFVLLAAYAIVRERWRWVMPALVAAVLVKYVPLLLVPPLLVYVLRLCRSRRTWQPLRDLAIGAGGAVAGAVLIWLPFWAGSRGFAVLSELDQMYTSTPGLVAYHLDVWGWSSPAAAGGHARALTAGLFAVVYLVLLWRVRPPLVRLFAVWYLCCFAALVLAAPTFRPWYFLWFVSVGALLPGWGYLVVSGVAAYTVGVAEIVEFYFERIPWIQDSYGRMLAAPVVVQFLPAVVCLGWWLLRTRSLLLQRSHPPASAAAERAAAGGAGAVPIRHGREPIP